MPVWMYKKRDGWLHEGVAVRLLTLGVILGRTKRERRRKFCYAAESRIQHLLDSTHVAVIPGAVSGERGRMGDRLAAPG